MIRVRLNEKQREALSWHLNPHNKEGDVWELSEPMVLYVKGVSVKDKEGITRYREFANVNGNWLLLDGSWSQIDPQDYYTERQEEVNAGWD